MEMRMLQLQEEGAEATFDSKPYLQDYYTRHLEDNTFVSWLAIDDNKIVGTSGMMLLKSRLIIVVLVEKLVCYQVCMLLR